VTVPIRALCGLLTVAALAAPPEAPAQARHATPRIGILSPFNGRSDAFRLALEERLAELGYRDGRNVAVVYRTADGTGYALPSLALDLVRQDVDIIVTTTALGAQAAKQATSAVPIVIAGVDDAVEQGFVASLARPGGNITGISWLNTELNAKRVELIKQSLPGISRVAYLREAAGGGAPLRATEAAARALGMRLFVMEIRLPGELESVFEALSRERVGAVVVAQGPMIENEESRIVKLAARYRLPTIFAFRKSVELGGLMSYGPKPADLFRRAADFSDRILKGANPREIPFEQPTSFELVVNLRTADALRVRLPRAILLSADDVVR
jgi:ABC-type uncharacterized transport system substrate-binding protein